MHNSFSINPTVAKSMPPFRIHFGDTILQFDISYPFPVRYSHFLIQFNRRAYIQCWSTKHVHFTIYTVKYMSEIQQSKSLKHHLNFPHILTWYRQIPIPCLCKREDSSFNQVIHQRAMLLLDMRKHIASIYLSQLLTKTKQFDSRLIQRPTIELDWIKTQSFF